MKRQSRRCSPSDNKATGRKQLSKSWRRKLRCQGFFWIADFNSFLASSVVALWCVVFLFQVHCLDFFGIWSCSVSNELELLSLRTLRWYLEKVSSRSGMIGWIEPTPTLTPSFRKWNPSGNFLGLKPVPSFLKNKTSQSTPHEPWTKTKQNDTCPHALLQSSRVRRFSWSCDTVHTCKASCNSWARWPRPKLPKTWDSNKPRATGFFTNGLDIFSSFCAGHESKSEKMGISQDLIESTCLALFLRYQINPNDPIYGARWYQ